MSDDGRSISTSTDRELLILIYERQKVMFHSLQEYRDDHKDVETKVIELEKYRATHDQITAERIKQIDDHEYRIMESETFQTQWKAKTATVVATVGGVLVVVDIVLRTVFHV